MIASVAVYLSGIVCLLFWVDRRMRSAQAAREAAFLRWGFSSLRRPGDRLSLGATGVPLRLVVSGAAQSFDGSGS